MIASGYGTTTYELLDSILRKRFKIGEVIALIEDHPFAGRSRNEVRSGLRSFAASPHIVFYRVVDGAPQIVRVLDGRQDIEEKFAVRDNDRGGSI